MPEHEIDVTFWKHAYVDHGPAILAFLRSRLGQADVAEELMQETFVRAIRSAERLRDANKVRSYLFTTAHNLIRNHHRRTTASPLVPADDEHEIADSDAADAHARLRSLVDRLTVVLEAMPEAHRRAFELGVLDRIPYREIARQTGWSSSQVKINVYRARQRVIRELAEYFDGEENVQ